MYSREFARKVGDVGITDFHQARSKEAGELYYQDNDVQCEQVFGEGEREELLQKAWCVEKLKRRMQRPYSLRARIG